MIQQRDFIVGPSKRRKREQKVFHIIHSIVCIAAEQIWFMMQQCLLIKNVNSCGCFQISTSKLPKLSRFRNSHLKINFLLKKGPGDLGLVNDLWRKVFGCGQNGDTHQEEAQQKLFTLICFKYHSIYILTLVWILIGVCCIHINSIKWQISTQLRFFFDKTGRVLHATTGIWILAIRWRSYKKNEIQ